MAAAGVGLAGRLFRRPALAAAAALLLIAALLPAPWPGLPGRADDRRDALAASAGPIAFVPNAGQSDPEVRFQAAALGGSVFFAPGEVVLSLPTAAAPRPRRLPPGGLDRIAAPPPRPRPVVARLRFEAANPAPAVEAIDPRAGRVSYLRGRDPAGWLTDLPTYGGVVYRDLYPGVDLRYDGAAGALKGTYLVAAGADPAAIRWRYEGGVDLRIDGATGDLRVALAPTADGVAGPVLTERAPTAWQEIDGRSVAVDIQYALGDDGAVGFALGPFDASRPLTLDPTLVYSSFLGGSGDDIPYEVAIDGAGNAYVAGYTDSTDFPLLGAPQPDYGGGDFDAFLTKLSPTGQLIYSTYLGGESDDEAFSVAADPSGNAYVTGKTWSADFPTLNARQPFRPGPYLSAFVVKLGPVGQPIYSTYLGGSLAEQATVIAADQAGNAYVGGASASPDFPLVNPFQASNAGNDDAFLVKLDPTGQTLLFSTLLGGDSQDALAGIALDAAGSVHLVGMTTSTNFPTRNAAQTTFAGGGFDFVVVKVDPTGRQLVYSTYLGGSETDFAHGIALDGGGNAHIVGFTDSLDFPILNAFQPAYAGLVDAVVAKLSPTGVPIYSTYLGGDSVEFGLGIAADRDGNAYVVGLTASPRFPTTSDAMQPSLAGADAYLVKLGRGGELLYGTFVGGSSVEGAFGGAIDGQGSVWVAGVTDSDDFPLVQPAQASPGGGFFDAFIAKVAFQGTTARRAARRAAGGAPTPTIPPVSTVVPGRNETPVAAGNVSLPRGGGRLSAGDGRVVVGVPPNALSTATALEFQPRPLPTPGSQRPVGAFALLANGGATTGFDEELMIQVAYDPDTLGTVDERTLALYTTVNGVRQRLDSRVYPAARVVVGFTSHFTEFEFAGSDLPTPTPRAGPSRPLPTALPGGTRLELPLLPRGAAMGAIPGTFQSALVVVNSGREDASVRVSFVREDGAAATDAPTTLTVRAGASATIYVPDLPGLADGRYAALVDADRPVQAVVNLASESPPLSASYSGLAQLEAGTLYYLPSVYRRYFGFSSSVVVQNTGSAPAAVVVTYRRPGISDVVEARSLAPGAAAAFDQTDTPGLADGFVGSAIVSSDQPVVAILNVLGTVPNAQLASTNGVRSGAPVVSLPVVHNRYFDFDTSVLVQNVDRAAATVKITYYDARTGQAVGSESRVVQPGASQLFLQYDTPGRSAVVPAGFNGSAVVTSSEGRLLVAIGNIQQSRQGYLAAYNGFAAAAATTRVSCPAILKSYHDYNTSLTVQNSGSAPTNLTLSYVDTSGRPVHTATVANLAPGATFFNYTPSNEALPDGFSGGVVITSSGERIVAVVNELRGTGERSGDQLFTYACANG
jgi:hypothetical protein